jgi:nucleolar GTP-binding protein
MSSIYNFKKIQVVPSSNDFIDIVLSKTQRKTPTVVHRHYQISRIRSFYMRKVKFTQDAFDEKLTHILTEFPKLDEIHPFYADLMNVLYDRDHYKLALGQINTCKHLIDCVGRDYLRLLKFGDSLYRCKQLKKAALGRMATIMKRQKDTLAYLEQIRQHLARMPSIDPNTRTLLICGYPNVGKSSFMNKVTRAEVDVQPYAFTTKSLFVGHMDYKYLRWQVIDTPGILDHPLEERNTIEMLSITALAHLRACVLFFIDISEQCGYTISAQLALFNSIKPLFANKPFILVLTKIDTKRMENLNEEDRKQIEEIGIPFSQLSTYTGEGVMETRNDACEKLLSMRVENKMQKMKSKLNDVLNKIHVAVPIERDDKSRPPFVPDTVRCKPTVLQRHIEDQNGGAGVYNINLKDKYFLENEEWKNDIIPEIYVGHNIADFIDPEIEEKLEELEREEERLEESGNYDSDENVVENEMSKRIKSLSKCVMDNKIVAMKKKTLSKGKNRPTITDSQKARILAKKMNSSKMDMQIDDNSVRKRSKSVAENIVAAEAASGDFTISKKSDRREFGLRGEDDIEKTRILKKKFGKVSSLNAKKGEGDRTVLISRPKHLFSGKRGNGSNDRR